MLNCLIRKLVKKIAIAREKCTFYVTFKIREDKVTKDEISRDSVFIFIKWGSLEIYLTVPYRDYIFLFVNKDYNNHSLLGTVIYIKLSSKIEYVTKCLFIETATRAH